MCEFPSSRPSTEDHCWDEIPSNINIHPNTQRYNGIVRGKNALTIESVADHDMKEIFYSWINGLWTGAKVLPKMSQFTRFSQVNSKNLACAKHSQNECTLRPDEIPRYIHSTMQKYPGIVRWISCWSMTFEGAPRFPKQQNDLSVQWPGKLITFSLGGSNTEMWYVFFPTHILDFSGRSRRESGCSPLPSLVLSFLFLERSLSWRQ